ncbi:DUF3078 domain-containing protein [Cesiribacter sp. SM1]|uniref:DUF3078 domain-containing protein n=1 Tax=Cesiribacter sp. SM1 TaxID=2861196 RepID=UPI001CD4D8F4|nr:DUF3078 domain-containing protein [Cesiribacter sp. SM1]
MNKTIQFSLSLAVLLFIAAGTASNAQTVAPDAPVGDTIRYWTTGGSTGLNFSQVMLNNWAGGGESSISIASLQKLRAHYARGRSLWENRLNVAFGLIRQGDDDNDNFRKTDDIFQLQSQYNYRISPDSNFYVTAQADFRTQMAAGYEYLEENGEQRRELISDFLAPGFLLTSIGVTYKKPARFSVSVSPVTGKFTFVRNERLSNAGAFGVEPGESMRAEFGASLTSSYEKEVLTNITFTTNLGLFANYDSFSHIDVNWEGTLVMKVNRFINSTVSAQLIYDHDVLQKTQLRNVINVGFLYKWPNAG